jgi:formylglycine-generating enzyme required for sulfatase activity
MVLLLGCHLSHRLELRDSDTDSWDAGGAPSDAGLRLVAFCDYGGACASCGGHDRLDCASCWAGRIFCAYVDDATSCAAHSDEVACPNEMIVPRPPPRLEEPGEPNACAVAAETCVTPGSDGQICVPGGVFVMGDDRQIDSSPPREVYVSPFWMDRLPVTVGRVRECIASGFCALSRSHPLLADEVNDPLPMRGLSSAGMAHVCEWTGGRLPTEAEWERAARGDDRRTYPWGEELGCEYANWGGCVGSPTPADGYLLGASPYGVLDMLGNAPELTTDGWLSGGYESYWYLDACDPVALQHDGGGAGGRAMVQRGCDFHGDMESCTAFHRSRTLSGTTSAGWRCVRDGVPREEEP